MSWRDAHGLAPKSVCRCASCAAEILNRRGPQVLCRTCSAAIRRQRQHGYYLRRVERARDPVGFARRAAAVEAWVSVFRSAIDEARV